MTSLPGNTFARAQQQTLVRRCQTDFRLLHLSSLLQLHRTDCCRCSFHSPQLHLLELVAHIPDEQDLGTAGADTAVTRRIHGTLQTKDCAFSQNLSSNKAALAMRATWQTSASSLQQPPNTQAHASHQQMHTQQYSHTHLAPVAAWLQHLMDTRHCNRASDLCMQLF